MTLWINKDVTESNTIFRFSGRMRCSELAELKIQLETATTSLVLDLEEVTLVDVEVVRFLNGCVEKGVEVRHGPLYIREWMLREVQKHSAD